MEKVSALNSNFVARIGMIARAGSDPLNPTNGDVTPGNGLLSIAILLLSICLI